MVSDAHKAVLRSTWSGLKGGGLDQAGKALMVRISQAHPDVYKVFPFGGEDAASSGGAARTGTAVLTQIDEAISHLDNLGAITGKLEALAQKHIGFGAKKAHFPLVGEDLMHVLEQRCGNWSGDARAAWTEVYGVLAGILSGPLG